jgi:uncharacterized protein (TIGR02265 family)
VGEISLRIKGTQLLGVVKALRAQRGRAAELAPAHLRRYFEERVLAASWYPETDFRDLLLLLGRMAAPGVKGNVWRLIGQMGAERDFKGIYASLIRPGDVPGTLRLFPSAWRQFRDQSQLGCEELGPGAAQLTLRDYPVNCRELAEVNAAYFETALRLAGGTSVSVTVVSWDDSSACWQVRWE